MTPAMVISRGGEYTQGIGLLVAKFVIKPIPAKKITNKRILMNTLRKAFIVDLSILRFDYDQTAVH